MQNGCLGYEEITENVRLECPAQLLSGDVQNVFLRLPKGGIIHQNTKAAELIFASETSFPQASVEPHRPDLMTGSAPFFTSPFDDRSIVVALVVKHRNLSPSITKRWRSRPVPRSAAVIKAHLSFGFPADVYSLKLMLSSGDITSWLAE